MLHIIIDVDNGIGLLKAKGTDSEIRGDFCNMLRTIFQDECASRAFTEAMGIISEEFDKEIQENGKNDISN